MHCSDRSESHTSNESFPRDQARYLRHIQQTEAWSIPRPLAARSSNRPRNIETRYRCDPFAEGRRWTAGVLVDIVFEKLVYNDTAFDEHQGGGTLVI